MTSKYRINLILINSIPYFYNYGYRTIKLMALQNNRFFSKLVKLSTQGDSYKTFTIDSHNCTLKIVITLNNVMHKFEKYEFLEKEGRLSVYYEMFPKLVKLKISCDLNEAFSIFNPA